MANIITYPPITTVAGEDLMIVSDTSLEGNPTRTVSVDALGTYIGSAQTLGYTSYVQLLTQNGTDAPTGSVLENTAGITITWAYGSSGIYTATYSTSLPDINKAAVSCSQTTKSSEGGMIVGITASSAPGFNLICKDTNGAGADSQLLGAVLEIRIYS